MTVTAQAQALLEQQGCSLNAILALYSHFPRVLVSTPSLFLAMRPVNARDCQLTEDEGDWPIAECDTWFVRLFVGRVSDIWAHVPFELPYVVYRRSHNQSLHFHRVAHVKALSQTWEPSAT